MSQIIEQQAEKRHAAEITARELGAMDEAREAIEKARALVCMTYGQAGDSFREMADGLQESFMWAVADLLHKAQAQLNRLPDRLPAMAPAPAMPDEAEYLDFQEWLERKAKPKDAAKAAQLFEQYQADMVKADEAWRKSA